MKKKRVKTLTILVAAMLVTGCKQAPEMRHEVEYATLQISRTDRELRQTYPAAIRGRQDIEIYPQVDGSISEVAVKEGEKVRKTRLSLLLTRYPTKRLYRQLRPMYRQPGQV